MAEDEKDKQLDDLLDSLLSRYSSAEPRPGFETRILAQVKEATAPGKPWFWNLRWLAAGAAGAAVVAVIMFILFSRTATAPRPQPPIVNNRKVPSPSMMLPLVVVAPKAVREPRVSPQPQPEEPTVVARQAVFPAPTPLSEQERLMLRYLVATPKEELIAQSRPDEPHVDLEQEAAPPPRDLTQVPQRSSNTQ